MADQKLLSLLQCPDTRQSLGLADATLLAKINSRIAAGDLRNRAGHTITEPCEAGLVREDGQVLYCLRGGIAVMIAEEGIPLDQLEDHS